MVNFPDGPEVILMVVMVVVMMMVMMMAMVLMMVMLVILEKAFYNADDVGDCLYQLKQI